MNKDVQKQNVKELQLMQVKLKQQKHEYDRLAVKKLELLMLLLNTQHNNQLL